MADADVMGTGGTPIGGGGGGGTLVRAPSPLAFNSIPNNPGTNPLNQLTGTTGTTGALQYGGQGLTAADTLNLQKLQGDIDLSKIAAQNAGSQNIANTQLLGTLGGDLLGNAGTYNNTLAGGQLQMLNTIAGNETSPQMEANIYNQGVKNQFLPGIASLFSQILGSPLLQNTLAGNLPGGAGAGGGLPAGASGPANAPIPLAVMNPYSAQGLIDQNTGNAAASTANQLGAVTPSGATPALAQQLMGQGVANNRAGLTDAATNFLGSLAPMNAQQALSGAQLAEGQRGNYLGNLLAQRQIDTRNQGNLLQFLNSITGSVMGGS